MQPMAIFSAAGVRFTNTFSLTIHNWWKQLLLSSFCSWPSSGYNRDHSEYGLSQWEEALHSNASSHRPSPYPEWSLYTFWHMPQKHSCFDKCTTLWRSSCYGSNERKLKLNLNCEWKHEWSRLLFIIYNLWYEHNDHPQQTLSSWGKFYTYEKTSW